MKTLANSLTIKQPSESKNIEKKSSNAFSGKSGLMAALETKLQSKFAAGIEEGIKELKNEMKAVTRVQKNYDISLETGEIL